MRLATEFFLRLYVLRMQLIWDWVRKRANQSEKAELGRRNYIVWSEQTIGLEKGKKTDWLNELMKGKTVWWSNSWTGWLAGSQTERNDTLTTNDLTDWSTIEITKLTELTDLRTGGLRNSQHSGRMNWRTYWPDPDHKLQVNEMGDSLAHGRLKWRNKRLTDARTGGWRISWTKGLEIDYGERGKSNETTCKMWWEVCFGTNWWHHKSKHWTYSPHKGCHNHPTDGNINVLENEIQFR